MVCYVSASVISHRHQLSASEGKRQELQKESQFSYLKIRLETKYIKALA
jgi:hypothetical protein